MRTPQGASVAPTVQTYSVLITCLNKAGEWERSLAMFEEMRQRGIEPDAVNLTAFFSACEKGGECSRALKVKHNWAITACNALAASALASLISQAQPRPPLQANYWVFVLVCWSGGCFSPGGHKVHAP